MIEVRLGDLAALRVPAVLRPVASDWSPVTAVALRLEAVAGRVLREQCERLGELPIGSAAITGGGALPIHFLVHAVVRSHDEPVAPAIVRRALQNGLRRLREWAIEEVAMPPLGTGAGNLDAEESAEVMIPVLLEHGRSAPHPARVILVVESEYEREAFQNALGRLVPRAGA